MNNIKKAIDNGLCLSCGICVAVCPHKCLHMRNKRIKVDSKKCTECGLCQRYCPGLHSNNNLGKDIKERLEGMALESHVGRSRNLNVIKKSVSGGIVTEIVLALLKADIFEFAIGVKNREFDRECAMEIYEKTAGLDYQKSIYTMPSYTDVIMFIQCHNKKRVIVIGTGCIISAIKKYIKEMHLDVKNYFFIGLFCDCTLSPNIEIYFKNFERGTKDSIVGLDYRSKDDLRKWPGDVKLNFKKDYIYIPKTERQKVVKYFKNKRCLYCLDHMNTSADISIGDNYTNYHNDKLGSNSIVIRSELGRKAINLIRPYIHIYEVPYRNILDSQNINAKIDNYFYSKILEKKKSIRINEMIIEELTCKDKREIYKDYLKKLKRVAVGRRYKYIPVFWDIYLMIQNKESFKNRLSVIIKREGSSCL